MSEAVTKTAIGACEEIEQKPGSEWVKFKINVGTQYPVGLSTKLPALIEQARAVGSEVATWTYKESDGGENPNRPGTFYKNRWLDKVEAGAHPVAEDNTGVTKVDPGTTAAAPQRPAEGTHKLMPLGDEKRAIVREACLHYAAMIYQGHGADKRGESTEDAPVWQDEAVTLTIMAAARMENWVLRDIDPDGLPF